MSRLVPPAASQLKVVCLGASAGGLEALAEFFDALPNATGAAYVVIVHLSPDFKSLMPELLARRTSMSVESARDGTAPQAEHIYIIPAGTNMLFLDGRLRLQVQDRRPGHALNLPIDLFLDSAATECGPNALAIILSGTGSDGSRGVRAIKENGGVVLVQSQASAKFDGMPLSAKQTGAVDAEGSPTELAKRVVQILSAVIPEVPSDDAEANQFTHYSDLVGILSKNGPDFSYLRPAMVLRRVQRRMAIAGFVQFPEYLQYLNKDPSELNQLGSDLLINVTQFFRDPDAFEALKTKALPKLLTQVPSGEPLRVWVTACATGQEVYSLIMLLLETMELSGVTRPLRVFGTDIDERALHIASRGRYSLSEIAGIRPALLSRYFEQQDGSFVVTPELRRMVIFARHNLVTDPPFTKMDLVSCRNLLIYLRPEAQQRVLTSLYWALQPARGVLMLGSAEDVGPLQGSLLPLDARGRLYSRTGAAPDASPQRQFLREPISVIGGDLASARQWPPEEHTTRLLRTALEASFEAESRSAALIDSNCRVVDVLTDPVGVFRLPKGRPTADLSRILPGAVMSATLNAMKRADGRRPVQTTVPIDGGLSYQVMVQAVPSPVVGEAGQYLLVIRAHRHSDEGPIQSSELSLNDRQHIATLEGELRLTKESLQATIEELQSANEEQQSTNEELVASNEELQSTNEELQSVNEELFTVNAEYQKRNQDLVIVSADLDNLLRSLSVATLYLDAELRVRRFTPALTKYIPLRDADLGRPVSDFVHSLDVNLEAEASWVRDRGEVKETEVRNRAGAWLLMQTHPYRSLHREGQGVLITLVDVTRIKNTEAAARVIGEQLRESNAKLTAQANQLEDLFSIVAHDLKRPIMGIDGMLHLLQRSLERGAKDEALRYLCQAFDSLDALRALLRDLIQLSQQTRAELTLEDVPVREWLDELLQPFVERAKAAGARFSWAADGHHARFSRAAASGVLVNLVENALLHGIGEISPRVDVVCQVTVDLVRVVVADNGPGIAPENHEKVFELFRRLNPEKTSGTGVGLVAARRLAWRAGGNVRLESDLGKGAKFILELPNSPQSGELLRQVDLGQSILLVEDDTADAKRVRAELAGCNVLCVSTLAEAKRAVSTQRFALILLDLSLPDGHGLSLLAALRESMNTDTLVIVLSGHPQGVPEGSLRSSHVVASMDKNDLEDGALRELVKMHAGSAV